MLQPTTWSPAASGERVLIVEDHDDTREMLETLLIEYGFEVKSAGNAAVALALARAWRPDAVIVDLKMPVVTGVQLARALRSLEATRCVPIVACTGYTRTTSIDEALSAGCDAVIIKPFDPDLLVTRLRSMLAAHASPMPRERQTA